MQAVSAVQPASIGLTEKIGYALGDTASNLIFQILILFALNYYTNVVGIEPAIVGGLFLIVRGIDAITDPIMGRIADKTSTRMGRYRPWLLWLAVPFGVAGVLTFAVPQASANVEIAYVFVTYILITLVYTAINIPYSALISSMTADPVERQQIQSWRFVGGQLGALSISMLTLPLVNALGGGADGWRNTLIVFGIAAAIMFFICFLTTHERIGTTGQATEDSAGSVWGDLGRLWQNDQWRILSAINFVLLTAIVMRAQTVTYFIQDSMAVPAEESGNLISTYFTLGAVAAITGSFVPNVIANRLTVQKLMLPLGSQFGLTALVVALGFVPLSLGILGCVVMLLALGGSILIGRQVDRVHMLGVMFAAQVVGQIALFFVGTSSFVLSALTFALLGFLNQVAVPILWTLMADCVDYGEAKTGHRLPALTFSTILFALKLGIALAGFIGAVLLSWYGYQTPTKAGDLVVQSDATRQGIIVIFALVPAAITCVLVWLASRVTLTSHRMRDVHAQLTVQPQTA